VRRVELEEASTHKSAKAVSLNRDLDILHFDPKIKLRFKDSSWNIFVISLVILDASIFEIVRKSNHRQTAVKTTSANAVGVGKYCY